jgi:uncharacterized membrane protein
MPPKKNPFSADPFQAPPFLAPPSAPGLVPGALFFLAALVPSLIPRSDVVQGATAGVAFAIGYGLGVGLRQIGLALQLVRPKATSQAIMRAAAGASAGLIAFGLWKAGDWQDGIRTAMQMPPTDTFRPVVTGLVALAIALVLVALGRMFRLVWMRAARVLRVAIPTNAALALGFVLVAAATWSLASGAASRYAVRGLDTAYGRLDAVLPPGGTAPADPLKSGSAASLVRWAALGAQGRAHVAAAPDRRAIEAMTGKAAQEPIRVYVGLNAARSPRERAELALAELKRVDAFARATLVVSTPTGTGWVDPAATQPLEYLLHGNVATVSVQYSYLPSWLSLLTEPERGAETAREVFRAVYGHWASLPPERRPRLYLFGLSLGALNSDFGVDIYDVLGAPYQGALWVGPPFASRTWRTVVDRRAGDTPVWLPRYSDGRLFRFATQDTDLQTGYGDWGPLRIVYLQYPSDPIVFFEAGSFWRRPAITRAPLPPDVSPRLDWFPVVSFVQSMGDMMIATSTPVGYGHVYAARHYLDAWAALLDPEGWPPEKIAALKRHLTASGL